MANKASGEVKSTEALVGWEVVCITDNGNQRAAEIFYSP